MTDEKKVETIEEKKNDAKEVAEILQDILKERKGEALSLIQGFALGAARKEVM